MLKKFAAAGLALAFLSGIVLAAEYEGVLTSIDKKTVKIKVKGEDTEKVLNYSSTTTFEGKVGKKGDRVDASADSLTTHLESKAGKKGVRVKITTKGEGKDEVITSIKIAGRKGKKKADAE